MGLQKAATLAAATLGSTSLTAHSAQRVQRALTAALARLRCSALRVLGVQSPVSTPSRAPQVLPALLLGQPRVLTARSARRGRFLQRVQYTASLAPLDFLVAPLALPPRSAQVLAARHLATAALQALLVPPMPLCVALAASALGVRPRPPFCAPLPQTATTRE